MPCTSPHLTALRTLHFRLLCCMANKQKPENLHSPCSLPECGCFSLCSLMCTSIVIGVCTEQRVVHIQKPLCNSKFTGGVCCAVRVAWCTGLLPAWHASRTLPLATPAPTDCPPKKTASCFSPCHPWQHSWAKHKCLSLLGEAATEGSRGCESGFPRLQSWRDHISEGLFPVS